MCLCDKGRIKKYKIKKIEKKIKKGNVKAAAATSVRMCWGRKKGSCLIDAALGTQNFPKWNYFSFSFFKELTKIFFGVLKKRRKNCESEKARLSHSWSLLCAFIYVYVVKGLHIYLPFVFSISLSPSISLSHHYRNKIYNELTIIWFLDGRRICRIKLHPSGGHLQVTSIKNWIFRQCATKYS